MRRILHSYSFLFLYLDSESDLQQNPRHVYLRVSPIELNDTDSQVSVLRTANTGKKKFHVLLPAAGADQRLLSMAKSVKMKHPARRGSFPQLP